MIKKLPSLVFCFFLLTRFIAIFFSTFYISDVSIYQNYSNSGLFFDLNVYKDFSFEYPPLAILPIYSAGVISDLSTKFVFYFLSFAASMFAIDLICLSLCKKFCKENLKMNEEQITFMVLLYSLFGLLLFKLLYHRLDLVVALFFTISLLLFKAENSKIKIGFFINYLLGFFYKISPAFTMPAAIIIKAFSADENLKKNILKICFNSSAFVISLALIIFGLEIYSDHHFIINMLYHEERAIQVESLYGSILLFKNLLLGKISPISNAFGAWNVAGNFYFELFAKTFGIIILLSFYLAIFVILLRKKIALKKIEILDANFLDVTLITILLTLTFQKVLSPQFFIWLMPVAAIWLAKNRSYKFLAAFSFIFFATFFIFSINYFALVLSESPILIIMLFLRNITLLALTYLISSKFLKTVSN